MLLTPRLVISLFSFKNSFLFDMKNDTDTKNAHTLREKREAEKQRKTPAGSPSWASFSKYESHLLLLSQSHQQQRTGPKAEYKVLQSGIVALQVLA